MKLKYAVVYERSPNNYSAYAPDVPGCISTGKTLDEMRKMMKEAITLHIESLMESGCPAPESQMSVSDAMSNHLVVLSEIGETTSELETTFGIVEVEVSPPHTVEEPASRESVHV